MPAKGATVTPTGTRGADIGTSEAALVARIAAAIARRPGTTLGIGDDAAVLEGDPPLLVTQDLLVEDVHFTRATTSWRELGHKALAVSLSDVAAMGGRPVAAVVGLALPRAARPSAADVDALYAGMEALAGRTRTTIAGGDVADAPGTAVVLSVTVIGRMEPGVAPVRRDGARIGDALAVTGPLGGAAAGLLALRDPVLAAAATPEEREALRRAHVLPEPCLAQGRALARVGVHAMMDVSDGLALDARRLALASRARVEIDLDAVPPAPGLARVAAGAGLDADVLAATGGEDYELLVAADAEGLARAADAGVPLHVVGRVRDGEPGLRVVRGGREVALRSLGWEHGT
jgi:thiamine-monophosphate kinase